MGAARAPVTGSGRCPPCRLMVSKPGYFSFDMLYPWDSVVSANSFIPVIFGLLLDRDRVYATVVFYKPDGIFGVRVKILHNNTSTIYSDDIFTLTPNIPNISNISIS